MSSTHEAIDLVGAIIICINWDDAQTAGCNRIGFLRENDVSFGLPTLRWSGRNK